jgi:hypothetical protein
LTYQCKTCKKLNTKKWIENNPEKVKEYNQKHKSKGESNVQKPKDDQAGSQQEKPFSPHWKRFSHRRLISRSL